MEVVEIVLLCFAALALLDRIFGSRLGIGTDFEKGINMAGTLILAMGGMLVLVPTIQWLLGGKYQQKNLLKDSKKLNSK